MQFMCVNFLIPTELAVEKFSMDWLIWENLWRVHKLFLTYLHKPKIAYMKIVW
jgi:hypothetical protein